MDGTPTRLDQLVGVLAKAVVGLWVGGFALLLVNSFVIEKHKLYLIALGAIRSGFLLALIILVAILGSVIARKVRKS